MAETGYAAFSTTVEKANHILHDIEQSYGWPKERRNQSYAALRTVLHVLRDRLPVGESVQFAGQLPMLVRGIYYEGWDPSDVPMKMDKEEFLARIRQEFTFDVDGGAQRLVETVMDALRRHVSQGQLEDVKSLLPKDLAMSIG
ncbi:DUF2267 domain-containing protein [Rugosimonospora acidiphila]|uniref:DUF2267 domain-containing protein n=1 Tax=Rugosimonospora acidiphila TaxID=556531 RepID=A0ABP9SI75_9ACTN